LEQILKMLKNQDSFNQLISQQIMNLQVVYDNKGNSSGVYIPSQEWTLIKQQYPDIEEISNDIPDWQKELLTSRLEVIAINPERVKPIQGLFDVLHKKVK
jgi:hypothetical protein